MLHEESNIQINCVAWFNLLYPQYRGLLFSVPNGGARNKRTACILKAEGVVAGVADLILFVPNKTYHALCIEMKTSKGVQRETQKEWQNKVENKGYKYIICRSFDQFVTEIEKYLCDVIK